MVGAEDEPIWRADPPEALKFVALDALNLLFHRPSGQTHIVDSPVPEILAALAEGPADLAGLLVRLARDHDLGEGNAAAAALGIRLAELEAAGLVRRG